MIVALPEDQQGGAPPRLRGVRRAGHLAQIAQQRLEPGGADGDGDEAHCVADPGLAEQAGGRGQIEVDDLVRQDAAGDHV